MNTRLSNLGYFLFSAIVFSSNLSVLADSAGQTGGEGWSEALPYYNRGNRYMSQGRYEDALHDYQAAVSKCTTDSDMFVNLGTAYEKVNDYANAQLAFEKAISLNKEDWSPWNNLANAYTKQDRLVDAVKAFEQALKHNPPAADKEAINKDIVDIKKILTAKGINTESNSIAKATLTPKGEAKSSPEAVKKESLPAVSNKTDKSGDWGY